MLNEELSSEDLNMTVGNLAIQQLIQQATGLFQLGYSKEEVEAVISKTFDLNNPNLRSAFDSLCTTYINNKEPETPLTR